MFGSTVWQRVLLGTLVAGVMATAGAGAASATPAVQSPVGGVVAEFPPGTPASELPTGVAWGKNSTGTIGNGSIVQAPNPTLVTGGTLLDGKELAAIDAGSTSACGISAGKLYCWGANSKGQLGIGTLDGSASPKLVGGALTGKTVTAVSVGGNSACAVASGKAYCWGDNEQGQVGVNTNTASYKSPTAVYTGGVLSGKTVSAISISYHHACAIASGKAYCWGTSASYQVGNGKAAGTYKAPEAVFATGVLNGLTVTSIATGYSHTCAVAGGKASCWGSNVRGQLGINVADPVKSTPTAVYATGNGYLKNRIVTALAAGANESCVIAGTDVRRAYCWGSNSGGELGNNDPANQDRFLPDAVFPGNEASPLYETSISSISVNNNGGCLISKGKAWCWGQDDSNRNGLGFSSSPKFPQPVTTSGVLNTRRVQTISAENSYTASIAVKPVVFTDVKTNHPFYDDISWQSGAGIAQGYADGRFIPGNTTDRQAMAAFVFRFKNPGIAVPKCTGNTRLFTDVPASNPFCGAIEWLVSAGIINPAPKFLPNGQMTRGVMATWLYRAHHPATADRTCTGVFRTFPDVTAQTPGCGNIEWLAATGITTGYNDDTYRPNTGVARDAMSAFMHRAQELNAH